MYMKAKFLGKGHEVCEIMDLRRNNPKSWNWTWRVGKSQDHFNDGHCNESQEEACRISEPFADYASMALMIPLVHPRHPAPLAHRTVGKHSLGACCQNAPGAVALKLTSRSPCQHGVHWVLPEGEECTGWGSLGGLGLLQPVRGTISFMVEVSSNQHCSDRSMVLLFRLQWRTLCNEGNH